MFLHSCANPRHERQAVDLIAKRYPRLALSASIDVAPEIREYERTSTTVINAYIKPLAERYLATLAAELATRAIGAPVLLMLSNGGLTGIEEAVRSPVQLLESGPAAGALAAAHLGSRDGGAHVLAFDMGGTTAKLSIVDDGKPKVAYSFEVARERRFIEGSGLPVRISTLELIEIGAGRRLDRPSRRHRPDEGRPRERRLRAGPGRLWAGWHPADRHRRRPSARLPQSRLLRRRQHDHRPGRRGSRHAAACRARRA